MLAASGSGLFAAVLGFFSVTAGFLSVAPVFVIADEAGFVGVAGAAEIGVEGADAAVGIGAADGATLSSCAIFAMTAAYFLSAVISTAGASSFVSVSISVAAFSAAAVSTAPSAAAFPSVDTRTSAFCEGLAVGASVSVKNRLSGVGYWLPLLALD